MGELREIRRYNNLEERAINLFLRAIETTHEAFWTLWCNTLEAEREDQALIPDLKTITQEFPRSRWRNSSTISHVHLHLSQWAQMQSQRRRKINSPVVGIYTARRKRDGGKCVTHSRRYTSLNSHPTGGNWETTQKNALRRGLMQIKREEGGDGLV